MSSEGFHGIWRHIRRAFRWLRILLLGLVLLAAAGLVILNLFGLPGFAKRPVLAALERAGLDLEFSKLRLRGFRRLVLHNVRIRNADGPAPVEMTAREATLRFNRDALRNLRLELDALEVQNGSFALGLRDTNAPDRSLVIEEIKAAIGVSGGTHWTLERFEGEALGARWTASGSLSNVVQAPREPTAAPRRKQDWTPALRELTATLEQVRFTSKPQVSITLLGDMNSPHSLRAGVSLRGESAATPWGEVKGVFLRTAVHPWESSGDQLEAQFSLSVDGAWTPWGEAQNALLLGRTLYPLTNSATFSSDWSIKAESITSRWFSGRQVDVSMMTTPAGSNLLTAITARAANADLRFGQAQRPLLQASLRHFYPVEALNHLVLAFLPVSPALRQSHALPSTAQFDPRGQGWSGDWTLEFGELKTARGSAERFAIRGDVRENGSRVETDESWGLWRRLAPFLVSWSADLTKFQSAEANVDRVTSIGRWRAPNLVIETVESQLYGGSFHFNAEYDISQRAVTASAASDFDLKRLAFLFKPEAPKWIRQLSWERPPKIGIRLALRLPEFGKDRTNWWGEALAATVANGSIATGPLAFGELSARGINTHFSLSRSQLRLPDFRLTRPEGDLRADAALRVQNPQFSASLRSAIDPAAVFPLFDARTRRELRILEFPEPPLLTGVITGNAASPESLHFDGALSVSNVIVRGRQFLDLRAALTYTNQLIELRDVLGHRTTNEVFSAPWALIDIPKGVMRVTNGFSTTDPYIVTEVIGREAQKAIAPYRFAAPPTVWVWGTIPLVDEDDADIHFQVEGGAFNYWRFNATSARAGVHWKGDELSVTNVSAGFYGGELDWEGYFKFRKKEADYRFRAVSINVNIAQMLTDLLQQTNHIEGALNGILVITEAGTEDLKTWRGHGQASLTNGFLWDIPLFGVFSEPLNAIAPGLGKSRVSSGTGTFKIENGRVNTEDMEVRAPAFRLNYAGSVDFEGGLEATMEAQFFRDAWVFGRAVSAVLWPLAKAFKARVTGNLAAPKSDFVHIPKIMLFPLRPIQTIKEVFSGDKTKEPEKEKITPLPPGPPPSNPAEQSSQPRRDK